MGEVVKLREAVATNEPLRTIIAFPAAGQLWIVCGQGGGDDDSEFRIVVRAPGAPDLLVASGPWPEGDPDEEWRDQIGVWIELIRATLKIAAKRVPALTDAPPNLASPPPAA